MLSFRLHPILLTCWRTCPRFAQPQVSEALVLRPSSSELTFHELEQRPRRACLNGCPHHRYSLTILPLQHSRFQMLTAGLTMISREPTLLHSLSPRFLLQPVRILKFRSHPGLRSQLSSSPQARAQPDQPYMSQGTTLVSCGVTK